MNFDQKKIMPRYFVIIVLITVGTYFRGFLVPDVATIAYVTMPDPLPVLELICGLYITRIDQYK